MDPKLRSVQPVNDFGQQVGPALEGWVPPEAPEPITLIGSYVSLEPLLEEHAGELFQLYEDEPDSLWTYMNIGPFRSESELRSAISSLRSQPGWLPFAIRVGDAMRGMMSYLRIDPAGGVIEIGSIVFSGHLQQTTAATEAIYLLIDHAFSLGYRRVEWKCDNLNGPSIKAALRLGFTYEGTFRKAGHYKGRSRDTAWFAIVDGDWPALRSTYKTWLDPANFDGSGAQLSSLRADSVEKPDVPPR